MTKENKKIITEGFELGFQVSKKDIEDTKEILKLAERELGKKFFNPNTKAGVFTFIRDETVYYTCFYHGMKLTTFDVESAANFLNGRLEGDGL
jgi:hypothetical protein